VSEKKYLILAEAFSHDPHYGKTLRGVMRYRRESVAAILDTQRAGENDDGVPIVADVEEGMQYTPDTALVGVVTQGGRFPGDWQELLKSCVRHGLDLENGLHVRLHDIPGLPELAREHNVALLDLREPPADLSTATGANLDVDATIVLTVGSDCAIGKMTATCELDLEARRRGLRSVFVPTGQTGIAIAGWGIAVDAVVSDFLAGAAERLVVEGAKRGDLLWVEGQGAILHPIYSGVTVGLIHGSAPHLYVLCHELGRTTTEGDPTESPLPSLAELIDLHERMSLKKRPAKVVAVALNTSTVAEDDARAAIAVAERETGLPTDDPVRFGAGRLLEAVLKAQP
jgi:uncharacterized NAD-dependent epimerase/dehydratase family protein